MSEGEKHRDDRNCETGPYGPGRGTLQEEQQQNRRHSGCAAERVAENHGSTVLCAVSADQILPAFDAGIVELVPLSEQGAAQARRTDMLEGDSRQRLHWRAILGLAHFGLELCAVTSATASGNLPRGAQRVESKSREGERHAIAACHERRFRGGADSRSSRMDRAAQNGHFAPLRRGRKARAFPHGRSGGELLVSRLGTTEDGSSVLEGRVNRMELLPLERWIGGVHLTAGAPKWRRDPVSGMLIAEKP